MPRWSLITDASHRVSSQEFHWSNGGLPQTFDPAFAAAPPDTDLVRAIFEGLTEYDPKTLTPVPAVAITLGAFERRKRMDVLTFVTTRVGPMAKL